MDNLEIQYKKLQFTERDERGRISERDYRRITTTGGEYLAWFHRDGEDGPVLFNALPVAKGERDMGDDNLLGAFPDIVIGEFVPASIVASIIDS